MQQQPKNHSFASMNHNINVRQVLDTQQKLCVVLTDQAVRIRHKSPYFDHPLEPLDLTKEKSFYIENLLQEDSIRQHVSLAHVGQHLQVLSVLELALGETTVAQSAHNFFFLLGKQEPARPTTDHVLPRGRFVEIEVRAGSSRHYFQVPQSSTLVSYDFKKDQIRYLSARHNLRQLKKQKDSKDEATLTPIDDLLVYSTYHDHQHDQILYYLSDVDLDANQSVSRVSMRGRAPTPRTSSPSPRVCPPPSAISDVLWSLKRQ